MEAFVKQNINHQEKGTTRKLNLKPSYRDKKSHFYSDLTERVDMYFRNSGFPKRGGLYLTLKTFVIMILYAGSYILMVSDWSTLYINLFWAFVFGAINVLIVFNIAHDASHNALFTSSKLNKLFSYTFNLVGTSSYFWDVTHNKIHHVYPNVGDFDSDIEQQAPYIRVSPTLEWKPYHRFQPYYAPLLYLTYSLFLIFIKDFRNAHLIPGHESELLDNHHVPLKEKVILIVSKLGYISLTIIVPFILIDASVLQFILGYIATHMFMSLLLGVVLIPVHMVDEAPFAVVNSNGEIEENWAIHVLKNTTDYARKSILANIVFGGLNTHLVHHLFPTVSHASYIELSKIIKETAKDHGLPYYDVSMPKAILSHFKLLKRMSRKP